MILSAAMLLMAATLVSCEKNYTCTCTYTDGAGMAQTNTGSVHGTKKQAENACNSNADDLKSIGTNVQCHL